MDINGFYAPSGAAFYASPIAGETLKSLKASSGLLHYLMVANTTAAVIYAHVYDNAAAAAGAPLMPPIPIAANSFTQVIMPFAIPFVNGCTVASSSTQKTFTAGGANDLQILAITK